MKNSYKILAIAFASVFGFSCERELDIDKSNADIIGNSLDIKKYVAVGNSITAGLSNSGGAENSGLYEEGQINSFPNIVANKFSLFGGGEFRQPLALGNGSGYNYIEKFENGSPIIKAKPEESAFYQPLTGDFNNLGVPGIRVRDVTVPQYSALNPFLKRMLDPAEVGRKSYIQLVQESKPTVFTCWLGNNDILGYATKGGQYGVDGIDPVSGKSGITPLSMFTPSYNAVISALISSSKQGVLFTLPNIVDIPFFTTIPYNSLSLEKGIVDALSPTISGLNQLIQGYNLQVIDQLKPSVQLTDAQVTTLKQGIGSLSGTWIEDVTTLMDGQKSALKANTRPFIEIKEGNNAFLIADSKLPGPLTLDVPNLGVIPFPKVRNMEKGELVLLSASVFLKELIVKATTGKLTSPLEALVPDAVMLTKYQIDTIQNARKEFNLVIKNAATANNLGLVDAEKLLERVGGQGEKHNGVRVTSKYIEGGVFSLDGVHLTPRGNSLIANEVLKELNNKFNSNFSKVNVANFAPVLLP